MTYVWNPANGEGSAVNLDRAARLDITGSGSAWGISSEIVSVAAPGTYSTKAAAVAALIELLETAGYVTLT